MSNENTYQALILLDNHEVSHYPTVKEISCYICFDFILGAAGFQKRLNSFARTRFVRVLAAKHNVDGGEGLLT